MANDRPVKVQFFESAHIRTAWDDAEEKWWFSALDVVAALTDQPDYTKARNYWKWLKGKLRQEGSEVVSVTHQLKMEAPDGKQRLTDVLDTLQVFRIIQSIPSRKAEPFKLWLTEHEAVAMRGGGVAKEARLRLEAETGKKVVSPQNAKQLQALSQAKSKKPEGGI